MSLELAFARDFVGWRNDHPRGAILNSGCAPGEEPLRGWSGYRVPAHRRGFFGFFVNASMAQRRRSSITEQLQTTYRCHRPPKTKYQSGEGSGGGGFFSASTSSAYGSQIARAYEGT